MCVREWQDVALEHRLGSHESGVMRGRLRRAARCSAEWRTTRNVTQIKKLVLLALSNGGRRKGVVLTAPRVSGWPKHRAEVAPDLNLQAALTFHHTLE